LLQESTRESFVKLNRATVILARKLLVLNLDREAKDIRAFLMFQTRRGNPPFNAAGTRQRAAFKGCSRVLGDIGARRSVFFENVSY
jgi:hypothetical protein